MLNNEVQAADDNTFRVISFAPLANDVTAFISPTYDINGDACSLVKVVAPREFAFSTPLGVVKREDKTGEIWLWLPAGTKALTIKHPQWGVMRDYRLGTKLESRLTYELRLSVPKPLSVVKHDTITVTHNVVDTVKIERPRTPLAVHLLATASFHTGGPSFGIMAMALWRHGFFVHASSNMKSTGDCTITCDKSGYVEGQSAMPYYTGEVKQSSYTITAGAAHRLYKSLVLFEGIGYGQSRTAWQLAESEGGGYALNEGLSHKGLTGEIGLLCSFHRLSVSASVLSIAGKQWQGCVGVGIRLGKIKR